MPSPLRALVAVTALAAAVALPAAAATGPWQGNPQSRVRLLSPWAEAPATGPLRLGLEFETRPGWHVYWKNSGDAGYPPSLDFAPTPEVTGAALRWPAPERYALPGDLEAYGYEGGVVYPVVGRLAAAGARAVTLAADLDYLVCEVDCIPYRYRLELEQPLAAPGAPAVEDAAAARRLAHWEARVPVPLAAVPGLDGAAELVIEAAEARLEVRLAGAVAWPGAPRPDLFLEASDRFRAGRPEPLPGGAGGPLAFRVPLTFPGGPPAVPLEVAWTVTGLSRPDGGDAAPLAVEGRQLLTPREAPAAAGGGGRAGRRAAAGGGGLLVVALLGGLLLHLTPTLLPVLVVRALEVRAAQEAAGDGAASRGARATALAAFAGGLALGGLALAARRAGLAAAWGAQLQEPGLVTLLALAATLLALNLWGFFRHPLALVPAAAAAPPGADVGRAMAVGRARPRLAQPWSLPPLARSLGPAVAAGPLPGLAAFAVLGLALALPYLVLAAWPGLVRRLPAPWAEGGPRPWARHLSEALGFVAAAGALWLLYLLSRQLPSDALALIELALLALALVAWLRATTRRRRLAAALGVVLAGLALLVVWLAERQRLAPRPEPPPATSAVSPSNHPVDPRLDAHDEPQNGA